MRKEDLGSWKNRVLKSATVVALSASGLLSMLTAPALAQSAPSHSQTDPAPAPQSLEAMEAAGVKLSFDVASVKPSKSDGRPYSNVPLGRGAVSPPTGGLFAATNVPLIAYVVFAFNLTSAQILRLQTQLPKWATTDRFDIQARAEGNPTIDQMSLMMQSLLADRFKLAVHTDRKEGPVYALVLAKPGKSGPRLQPDAQPCSIEGQSPTPASPPPANPDPEYPTVCGFSMMQASAPGRLRVGGRSVTMGLITAYLTGPITGVDRSVVDETGLSGAFDFVIEFSLQTSGPLPPGANFQPDPDGPSFLQALQEQLGLKLESQTRPINAFVIDHVEEPSPN